MKRTIRLNESELKRMIAESVKGAINELDWKTYASASDKARQRGISYWRDKGETGPHNLLTKATSSQYRADRFADTARDAFNRNFGYQQGKPYDDDYERVAMGGDFRSTEEFGPHAVGYKSKGWGNPKKYEFGRDSDTLKSMSPEEFYQDDAGAAQAFKNADAEVKNYRRGNYNYQKGKGWQLKESIYRKIDRIVSESIRRNIR